ncbi:sulfite exporter TauE/SafE family protein [Candidatus Roizmanbacteria bacterium]|nr:sulfite exporter TauE/SafE family protein [Candidatus Roizmanbacteria bacterium]
MKQGCHISANEGEPLTKRLGDAGAIAIILFIIFYFISELHLFPKLSGVSSLSYLAVFILGIAASTSTCMATSGSLFVATIGKIPAEKKSFWKKIIPTVSFNLGRIIAYGAGGYIVGLFGRSISTSGLFGSYLSLGVGALMILIGLNMLHIISFSSLIRNSPTKGIFTRLETRLMKNPKKTAFFLGAITYLLPCGFTQTVQVYAIGLADPVKSALLMFFFALGTMPMLLALGFFQTLQYHSFYRTFSKIIGVLIFFFGMNYLGNFLFLRGVRLPLLTVASAKGAVASPITNGYQIVWMQVGSTGYYPATFTVKKDIPVRWIIDGKNVFGCQGFLVAPQLHVQKTLRIGENVVEFTPTEIGPISFSCAMGMFRGAFTVVS